MKKEFKQVIYHHPDSAWNTPGVTEDKLVNGTAFSKYLPLSQLGIRALPGTKVYLNGGTNPVIIGFSGLFDIDLTNGGSITEIRIDRNSLRSIANNNSAYLIVDMLGIGGSQ